MGDRRATLLTDILCSPLRAPISSATLLKYSHNLQSHSRQFNRYSRRAELGGEHSSVAKKQSFLTTRIQSASISSNQSNDSGKQQSSPSQAISEQTQAKKSDFENVSTKLDKLVSRVTDHSRRILNSWTGYALVESLNQATEEHSKRSTAVYKTGYSRPCQLSSINVLGAKLSVVKAEFSTTSNVPLALPQLPIL